MAGPVLDASTPAGTTITKNVTSMASNTFSPPANSMLVVFWGLQAVDSATAQSVTAMSNTGTALTWTRKVLANHSGAAPGGSAEIWWAYNANAQTGITVNGTFARASSGSGDLNGGVLVPKVFTGTPNSLSTAASALKNSTTAGAPTQSLTTTAANSWVWGVVVNWDNSTIGTAGTAQTITESINDTTAGDAEWVQKQNAVTAGSGTSVTINDTAPSTHYLLAMIEVLASAGTTNTATLTASGTGVVSLTRSVRPTKPVSGTGLVSLAKQMQSTRSVAGAGVVSLRKQVAHALATVSGTGLVSISRTYSLSLTASGVGIVSGPVKTIKPVKFVFGVGLPSISRRNVTATRTTTGVGLASIVKQASHRLDAVAGVGSATVTSAVVVVVTGPTIAYVALYDVPAYAVTLSDEAVDAANLTDEAAYAVALSDQG